MPSEDDLAGPGPLLPPGGAPSGIPPSLSVVVPSYNGSATLPACLDALRRSGHAGYELIVSDDGSTDGSADLAEARADLVLRGERQGGVAHARNCGAGRAKGSILCFVDQDVVVDPDTLERVAAFFGSHPTAAAVTCILSRRHPNADFFSQYKNLYMHFIFSELPDRVSFLYGSLYAVRRECFEEHDTRTLLPDTELGQRLHRAGKEVYLDKSLDVVHLKKYSMSKFFRNDFFIPFVWAEVFVLHRAWKRVGSGGFAHARTGQLASLVLAASTVLTALGGAFDRRILWASLIPLAAWILLNRRFMAFLRRERGWGFWLAAWGVTFIDHHVMLLGILAGFTAAAFGRRSNPPGWVPGAVDAKVQTPP